MCACVRLREQREARNTVWHTGTVNWIEDVRKDNDFLTAGSFPHSELDRAGKGPWRVAKPSKQSILQGKCQREPYHWHKWEYSVCQVGLLPYGRAVATKTGEKITVLRREGGTWRKESDNGLFFTQMSHIEQDFLPEKTPVASQQS